MERNNVPAAPWDELWTAEQVAEAIGCTLGWVYRLAREKKIPHRRRRGRVRFDPKAIEAWDQVEEIGADAP